MLDFDGETWSENADSARIFLSKYKDEIAETRRELQTATSQAERRKIETLEKVLRNPCCMQAIFELPGCSIMYRDGEWGFYKPPKMQPPQPELKKQSPGKRVLERANELPQEVCGLWERPHADLCGPCGLHPPLSMDEMLEEAPILPAECRPARRLTDDLGAFIRSLPSSAPITKDCISVLAEKLRMRPVEGAVGLDF